MAYVHSFNYAKAARVAIKLKDYDLASDYIEAFARRGYPIGFIQQKEFKKYLASEAYKDLEEKLVAINNGYASTINEVYMAKIDSLHFIDQTILRGNRTDVSFEIDSTISYSDSLNFDCLLKLMNELGFPSEQKIGYRGYRKAWVIIHHSARLPQNHKYHGMLLEYLKRGEYQPENYCWVVDQGRELNGEKLIYYHWDVAKNVDGLSKEHKEEIDKERKKIGMASIDRVEVKLKKGRKINNLKW